MMAGWLVILLFKQFKVMILLSMEMAHRQEALLFFRYDRRVLKVIKVESIDSPINLETM